MLVEDGTERAAAFKELESSLHALALSASDQLTLFPENIAAAGELASRFDRAWSVVSTAYERELSPSQVAALSAIERRLESMSRDGAVFDVDLWTESALTSSDHWAAVRRLARDALTELGVDGEAGSR